MRLPSTVDAVVDAAGRVGAHGLAVRGIMVAAAAGCWAVAGAVGEISPPATIVLVVVGIAAASRPDSGAPLALVATLTATWLLEVRPMSVGWSLALALCALVIHAASARAAALGEGAVVDADVARRWLAQTAVVGAATTAVWAVVVLLDRSSVSGGIAVSAAAIAVVMIFAVLVTRSVGDAST